MFWIAINKLLERLFSRVLASHQIGFPDGTVLGPLVKDGDDLGQSPHSGDPDAMREYTYLQMPDVNIWVEWLASAI